MGINSLQSMERDSKEKSNAACLLKLLQTPKTELSSSKSIAPRSLSPSPSSIALSITDSENPSGCELLLRSFLEFIAKKFDIDFSLLKSILFPKSEKTDSSLKSSISVKPESTCLGTYYTVIRDSAGMMMISFSFSSYIISLFKSNQIKLCPHTHIQPPTNLMQ